MFFQSKLIIERGAPLLAALLVLALGLFTSGCGGGSGSGSAPVGIDMTLTGYMQKGPLIAGSKIQIFELDDQFNPTGDSYITQTTDSTGSFMFTGTIGGSFVEVVADGFFYDEITGLLSPAQISLRAVIEAKAVSTANVNLLTTLAAPRIKELVQGGSSFTVARDTAKAEVLDMFNINAANIGSFTDMDITGTGDSNGVVLAVSALLLQVAREQSAAESEVVAKLSLLMTELGADLATDGIVTTQGFLNNLVPAAHRIDTASVLANLKSIYSGTGVTVTGSNFEGFIKNLGLLYPIQARAMPPKDLVGVSACEANGKIYFFGGKDLTQTYYNLVNEYDPVSDTWATKSLMPTARAYSTCGGENGIIYVIGGVNSGVGRTGIVEEYDTATDTWASKAVAPTARTSASSSIYNGKIYVFGGSTNNAIGVVEEYDIAMNTWASKAAMPTARDITAASLIGDKIYVIGGWDGSDSKVVEAYSPLTNTWETITSLPSPKGGPISATLNGKIYVFGGGVTVSQGSRDIFVFDPLLGVWEAKTPLDHPHAQDAGGVVSGKFYIVGMAAGYAASSANEEYDPSKDF